MTYRILATIYLACCLAGCAFPKSSLWYDAASQLYVPQVLRWIRLDFPNKPGILMFVYGLVVLFSIYCAWINVRLMFLVNMNRAAWHHSLDLPATRKLAMKSMTWKKPRLKPPGYTPHWVLLIMHLFFPTGSPMVYGVLFSTFVCEKIEDEWVARVDHSLHCYKGLHNVYVIVSLLLLALYYTMFVISSYIFVAATERLQNRNLELGLPSLIRDKRDAFLTLTQLSMLAIGFDSFLNQGTGLLTSLPSITLTAWVAVLTLLYLSYTKPCNIPLCNWVSFACFVFPLWAYACSAVTFFVNHNAMHLIVDVFLGGTISGIPAAVVIVLVLLKISKGGGKNSKIPAWFAVRQAEAQRREQCELSRINSARHMTKDDLGFDIEHLPTPRSVLGNRDRDRDRDKEHAKSWFNGKSDFKLKVRVDEAAESTTPMAQEIGDEADQSECTEEEVVSREDRPVLLQVGNRDGGYSPSPEPNKSMEDAREDARSTDDTESAPSSARAHGNTRLLQQQADWSDDRATFAEETVEVSEDQELNARRGSH